MSDIEFPLGSISCCGPVSRTFILFVSRPWHGPHNSISATRFIYIIIYMYVRTGKWCGVLQRRTQSHLFPSGTRREFGPRQIAEALALSAAAVCRLQRPPRSRRGRATREIVDTKSCVLRHSIMCTCLAFRCLGKKKFWFRTILTLAIYGIMQHIYIYIYRLSDALHGVHRITVETEIYAFFNDLYNGHSTLPWRSVSTRKTEILFTYVDRIFCYIIRSWYSVCVYISQ